MDKIEFANCKRANKTRELDEWERKLGGCNVREGQSSPDSLCNSSELFQYTFGDPVFQSCS